MRPDAAESEECSSGLSARAFCPRCVRLEERMEKMEEERRELSMENRRLWKENSVLRERCARFEEREKQGDGPFFPEARIMRSEERSESG